MAIDFKKLLNNLNCSQCKADFDENSVTVLKEENNILVVNLKCSKCGKDFGIALLNLTDKYPKNSFKVIEGPKPIDYDDVIDAHKFIKNLDKNWTDYLPKED